MSRRKSIFSLYILFMSKSKIPQKLISYSPQQYQYVLLPAYYGNWMFKKWWKWTQFFLLKKEYIYKKNTHWYFMKHGEASGRGYKGKGMVRLHTLTFWVAERHLLPWLRKSRRWERRADNWRVIPSSSDLTTCKSFD